MVRLALVTALLALGSCASDTERTAEISCECGLKALEGVNTENPSAEDGTVFVEDYTACVLKFEKELKELEVDQNQLMDILEEECPEVTKFRAKLMEE